MAAPPISAKFLLPLSTLVACPLTLLVAYNKNPEPDEAIQPTEATPQQDSAKTVIEAARLGAAIRPDLPQPSIERLTQPITPITADSLFNPTTLPVPPAHVPLVNVDAIGNASLEEIVSRSLASPFASRIASVPTSEETKSPAVQIPAIPDAVASPPDLPQTPAPAASPEPITADTMLRAAVEMPQPPEPSQSTSFQAAFHAQGNTAQNNTAPPTPDQAFHVSAVPSNFAPVVLLGQSPDSSGMIQKVKVDAPERQLKTIQYKASSLPSLRSTKAAIDRPHLIEATRWFADRLDHAAAPIAIASHSSLQVISSNVAPVAQTTSHSASAQATVAQATSAQATSVQSAAQSATSQSPVIGETYTLGAGDRISVNFFNVPEYSGDYQVAADGSVNLPVVGGASLKGLTLQEASRFIASLYQTELAHPRVAVNLTARRPLQVSIIGEVGQPGLYTLTPDQKSQVIQAIQMAGGFTQSANLRQVQIRRSFRGANQTISVNAWNLLQNGDLAQNLTLQDGDSLYVPASAAVDLADAERLANSNLATTASTQLKIALVGEVNHPGAYQLPSAAGARATLTQAIQSAGGITPTANVRQVQIRRTTRMGEPQTIDIDLWQLLQSGDLKQDLILQDGDTIVLTKAEQSSPAEALQLASTNLSPGKIQVTLQGEVKTAGSIDLPSNITLNQAILQAGGLNSRARRSAQFVRVSPTGTVSRRTIHLDFNQDANAESNPVLQNGDLIVVGRSSVTQVADGVANALDPILRIFAPFRGLLGF